VQHTKYILYICVCVTGSLKYEYTSVYLKSIQHGNISNPDSDTYGRKYAYVDDTLHFRLEPASTPLPLPNCSQRQLYLEA